MTAGEAVQAKHDHQFFGIPVGSLFMMQQIWTYFKCSTFVLSNVD